MNDEIKEILIKDFNEILVKEFCTDWKEKRLYIELLVNSTPFSNLLDYITNLQQELETRQYDINNLTYQLAKEKSRIEKAVEYIEEARKQDFMWTPIFMKELLNILNGRSDE